MLYVIVQSLQYDTIFTQRERWESRMLNKSLSKHCESFFPMQDDTKPLEAALQTTSASALLRNLLCS